MVDRGRLIALEGIDGCGKSTHTRLLADAVGAIATEEPGSTGLGRSLRALVLDPELPSVAPRTEALLLAADRAQHVAEVVAPALGTGRWVVTDRFSGSMLAYQGYGRGMDLDALRRLSAWAAQGIEPDLNVLVDVAPDVARARWRGVTPDRLERLDSAFHDRVRGGYLALARAEPERWAVVDANSDVDTVAAAILSTVVDRLGPLPTHPS